MTVCTTDHSSTMYYSKLALIETYVYFSVSMCPKLCSRAHGISYHNGVELILKSYFHFLRLMNSQVVLESLKLLSSNSEEKETFFVKSKVYKKWISDFNFILAPLWSVYVKDWGARLKGQLISKGNFGVFNSSKKRTWKF